MAKQYVVKTSGAVQGVAIAQDLKPVPLKNNKAPAAVTKGQTYALSYYFVGPAGSSISVSIEGAGDPVVLVKASKMPDGRTKHGKTIFFKAP